MPDESVQLKIRAQYGAQFLASFSTLKIGIAENARSGRMPINGLRHLPASGTTACYVWSGMTIEDRDDFFVPLHVSHAEEWSKLIFPYLGLAPGWRFPVSPDFVDVWFDISLLNTAQPH